MRAREGGYFETFVAGLGVGARYRYRVDGGELYPDPASAFQPEGVHGPSEVVDPSYPWQDEGWRGVPLRELVFYELHLGTFTPEGTYAAAEAKLDYLKALGVNALELMPVADFPGRWNWGYDPAAQFAPSRAYGRPEELKRFIDTAHRLGLAVYLDVVYNHFGPDGAYAVALAPQFFTDRHQTPWGQAINLDGEHAAGVRRFFLENARYWLEEYHFDGFRLDATFALIDDSPKHFLAELSETVEEVGGWKRFLVAEDHRNDRRLLEPRAEGGYGLDAVWADDFHHQVRVNLAGDRHGYYRDYGGSAREIAETINQGWFYIGQHAKHYGGPRGSDPNGLAPERFVFCIQNHDQIGNRPHGNRLDEDVSLEAYRAASALLLFAPQLPLIFMGQEWAASTPFQYFTDHNPELGKLVSEGRREEFKDFPGFAGEVPDPQDEATFKRSKLDWGEVDAGIHAQMLAYYRDLLRLRRELEGEVKAVRLAENGLELRRGRHLLQVALRKGVSLPEPEGYALVWQSEDARYSNDPSPIQREAGKTFFTVPGAALWERL
jgi:maltooligosyltrehalose trehalohydrolase